jgi:hypothetical protein
MDDVPTRALWEEGWKGHEQQQRERLSKLSFAEALQWLEEAHRLVLHMSSATPVLRDRPGDEPRS